MDYISCISKIDNYLTKTNVQPLIVDVENKHDLEELISHYQVGDRCFIDTADYTNNADEFPHFEELVNDVELSKVPVFVTGASSFLKLCGLESVRTRIRQYLDLNPNSNIVFLLYQCKKYLEFTDVRLKQRIIVCGDVDSTSKLCFASNKDLVPEGYSICTGISEFSHAFECSEKEKICILTTRTKADFEKSLIDFTVVASYFDAVCILDPAVTSLKSSFGTESQWCYALKLIKKYSCWSEVVDVIFSNHNALDLSLDSFKFFDSDKKWLYFVSLKIYGVKNNEYLQESVLSAESYTDLISNIFRAIIRVSPLDKKFKEYYRSRKKLLSVLEFDARELDYYCTLLRGKMGANALYYLTNNTPQEKELIFEVLSKYGSEYTRDELISIFKEVYPDLAQYLMPYQFKNNLLTSYFNEYKYQKVINKILPEFYQIVEEQAEKREYNTLLPRSALIEKINRKSAILYFIDALGVEYLNFILVECKRIGLAAKVQVCRSELPSITSVNKEFEELFDEDHRVCPKTLDDLKHHGMNNLDYQHTKLPIHLMAELDFLRNVLHNIRDRLSKGEFDKAIVVSDHGASRLAVIHETESIWSMINKGEHSGRCCLKSEVDKCPACATDAGDFWVLANYDRFKGSRKADVEVHGGATLEEVIVPILELVIPKRELEIHIISFDNPSADLSITPIINVSYKKKAKFKICSSEKLDDVYVAINEKCYPAEELEPCLYQVDIADIHVAKTYCVDVYASGRIIAENLPIIIKKESGGERDLL